MQTAALFLSRPANNQDFRDVDVTSWPTGFEVLNLVHIGGTEERVLSPLRHNTHFKHIEHKIKTEKNKTKQNKENSFNSWTNLTVFRRKTRWRTRKRLLDFYSTVLNLRKIIDVMDGGEDSPWDNRDDDVNKSFKTFCRPSDVFLVYSSFCGPQSFVIKDSYFQTVSW